MKIKTLDDLAMLHTPVETFHPAKCNDCGEFANSWKGGALGHEIRYAKCEHVKSPHPNGIIRHIDNGTSPKWCPRRKCE